MTISLQKASDPCVCSLCGRSGADSMKWPGADTPGTARYVIAPDGKILSCGLALAHWNCLQKAVVNGEVSSLDGPFLNVRAMEDDQGGILIEAYAVDYLGGGFVDSAKSSQWDALAGLLHRLGFGTSDNVRFAIVDVPSGPEAQEFSSPADLLNWSSEHSAAHRRADSWGYEKLGLLPKLGAATSILHANGVVPYEKWIKGVASLVESDPGILQAYDAYLKSNSLYKEYEEYALMSIYNKSVEYAKKYILKNKRRSPVADVLEKAVQYYHRGEGSRGWYEKSWEMLQNTFGEDARLMADLLASTSPQVSVSKNVEFALEVYRLYKLEGPEVPTVQAWADESESYEDTDDRPGAMWATYLPNILRSTHGEPLSGLKVWNFTKAIQGDPDAIVIDTWMSKAIFGEAAPARLTDAQYLFAEKTIHAVAEVLHSAPSEVSAADVTDPESESVIPPQVKSRPSYRNVQEQIWSGINNNPQDYQTMFPKKMQKQMKIHPEFWKQYNTPGADPEKEDAGEARASSWRRPVRRIS